MSKQDKNWETALLLSGISDRFDGFALTKKLLLWCQLTSMGDD